MFYGVCYCVMFSLLVSFVLAVGGFFIFIWDVLLWEEEKSDTGGIFDCLLLIGGRTKSSLRFLLLSF